MNRSSAWGLSFFVGAAVMILELTASRAVAPILGNSLYTWTAVIGVVLAGLSLGAYLGGRLVDHSPRIELLRNLFYISGGAVCVMMFLTQGMPAVALLPLSIPILATGISTILFFIPAVLLGAIQPMIVKLSTIEVDHLGRTYGTLSALWSLGSIVGVFLSGFYLIPLLGTWKTFLLVAGILFVSGIILSRKRTLSGVAVFVLLTLIWPSPEYQGAHVLFSKDTGYFRALVAQAKIEPFGDTRIFFLDIDTHSILRGTSTAPIYTDMTRLFSGGISTSSSVLLIGGGAYTMPNDLAQTPASVSVYELDPALPPIVEEYFSLNPKIMTTIGDARTLLRRENQTYDIIVGDSFNSYLSVPWHLLTREWNEEVAQHLRANGVYAVNIISTLEGEGSELYLSVDATLRETFPFVEAYAFGDNPEHIQNVFFLASRTSLEPWISLGKSLSILAGHTEKFEDRRVQAPPTPSAILTDDHAPTDTMLLPIAERALPASIRLYYGMTR